MKKITLVFVATITISGCVSSKKIKKRLDEKKYSIAYEINEKVKADSSKYQFSINLDSITFDSRRINDSTFVIKEKSIFIPLLLVNIWNSQNICFQGNNLIKEDLNNFVYSSFSKELEHSSNFKLDTLNTSEYKILLNVSELHTSAKYTNKGLFYFVLFYYGYNFTETAGPIESKLTIDYTIKKNNTILYRNSITSNYSMDRYHKVMTNRSDDFQYLLGKNMVKSTSENFKQTFKMIINDVELFFEKEN